MSFVKLNIYYIKVKYLLYKSKYYIEYSIHLMRERERERERETTNVLFLR